MQYTNYKLVPVCLHDRAFQLPHIENHCGKILKLSEDTESVTYSSERPLIFQFRSKAMNPKRKEKEHAGLTLYYNGELLYKSLTCDRPINGIILGCGVNANRL